MLKGPAKYRIRITAQDPPAGQNLPNLPEEPKQEETTPTDPKEFWAKFQQVAGPALANGLAVGTAVALMQMGFTDKKMIAKVKPQPLIGNFPQIVKLAMQQRQTFIQELRSVWRLGPKQYLYRAGAALRKG